MPKSSFVCSECEALHPQWTGQCKSCASWNTLEERAVEKKSPGGINRVGSKPANKIQKISSISVENIKRLQTNDSEFNRVLGGGLVPGGIILLGGEPGIGKSTLLLQTATSTKTKTLYLSGEESVNQIKMRADRLGYTNDDCYLISENNLDLVLNQAKELKPNLLIVDSIQTIFTPDVQASQGSVSQIRECANRIVQYCKQYDVPCIIVGHITKDGGLAGPKLLEHIVDTVLQFEGDKNYHYRILRAKKNRYGSTDEIGIFEMQSKGLVKVDNPSKLLLSQSLDHLSGSTVAATIQGMRPLLIETQALVSTSTYGNPQRSCTGFDNKRLNMLLAVLEKRVGMSFGMSDVFLNIAGGIKCTDPALDLSIIASVVSSFQDFQISKQVAFAGEVGLTGEIRSVHRVEERIKESERMGLTHLYLSQHSIDAIKTNTYGIELIGLSKVEELTNVLFS